MLPRRVWLQCVAVMSDFVELEMCCILSGKRDKETLYQIVLLGECKSEIHVTKLLLASAKE